MRRSAYPLALVLLLVSALGWLACAERRQTRARELAGLDRTLSTFAFIEEGNLVSLVVDTRATRYREKAGYIPLEIAIANLGVKQMTLTRESFTLHDSQGNKYACAGPKELMEKYEFLDLDRTLEELYSVVFNRYAALTRYPCKFSPTRAAPTNPFESGLVRDQVVIPKFGYLVDFIYFPTPGTGVLKQRFELFVTAPELPDPVFVKFAVL